MFRFFYYKKVLRMVLVSMVSILLISSCKKFIEVPAPNASVTEESVFSNDQTAIAAVTGLFARVSFGGSASSSLNPSVLSISKLAGLSADEFDLWSGASETERAYYENNLQTHYQGTAGSVEAGGEFWSLIYQVIYATNQALENLEKSDNLSPSVKQQLIGECRFYRAFLYFYTAVLYGDVPLVLGTSPEVNRKLPRLPVAKVYDQIIADLTEAKQLLSENFVNSSLQPYGNGAEERIRPNRWAATALLARVSLYTGEYGKASEAATEVINQVGLFDLAGVPLTSVFKKNSREAILQLQPVFSKWNTPEARMFYLNAEPAGFSTTKSVCLSQSLLQSFEEGDARQSLWVNIYSSANPFGDFYFPSKYTDATSNPDINSTTGSANMTEYSMVLRLAEQYLIRAEARAQTGDVQGAVDDVNIIRTRARSESTVQVPDPLPNLTTSLNQQQLLEAIWHEKRIELLAEWGHRWLDLKRTGKLNDVMQEATQLKGGSWQAYQSLFPLPARELNYAQQLTQNPGY